MTNYVFVLNTMTALKVNINLLRFHLLATNRSIISSDGCFRKIFLVFNKRPIVYIHILSCRDMLDNTYVFNKVDQYNQCQKFQHYLIPFFFNFILMVTLSTQHQKYHHKLSNSSEVAVMQLHFILFPVNKECMQEFLCN